MFIIHRKGNAKLERSVQITDGVGKSWHIDPQRELLDAAGVFLNRHGSIMDFAEGIRRTGETVLMHCHTRFNYYPPGMHELRERGTVGLEYFLVGYAWAKGDWDAVKRQLQIVNQSHRHEVLLATASHCCSTGGRFSGKVKLQFP